MGSVIQNVCIIGGALALLCGCAALDPNDRIVYQDSKIVVSLTPDASVNISHPSTLHDHPLQLSADQVSRILAGVAVDRSRGLLVSMVLGAQHEAAFSPDELAVLAPKISAGLAKAGAKDRVKVGLSRVFGSKPPETLEWALWGQGGGFYVALTRHRIIVDQQQSELSATLEGGATRGPGVSRDLPGDLAVGFSYPEYVIALEPPVATQLFGSPHASVVIDYRRFLAGGRSPTQISDRRATAVSSADQSGMSAAVGGTPPSDVGTPGSSKDIQALSERVKSLETQVNDLLGVVKQLTKELADSNKALSARDEEIRTLKGQAKPSDRQRKSSVP